MPGGGGGNCQLYVFDVINSIVSIAEKASKTKIERVTVLKTNNLQIATKKSKGQRALKETNSPKMYAT